MHIAQMCALRTVLIAQIHKCTEAQHTNTQTRKCINKISALEIVQIMCSLQSSLQGFMLCKSE